MGLETVIIWKTLEQSLVVLVVLAACGKADARNFQFNEIRVLNIGS